MIDSYYIGMASIYKTNLILPHVFQRTRDHGLSKDKNASMAAAIVDSENPKLFKATSSGHGGGCRFNEATAPSPTSPAMVLTAAPARLSPGSIDGLLEDRLLEKGYIYIYT